ncbi:MAG TPA: YraN family protein [Polyangiaceae bacterium]|nr:YraN family protein [Polyangiaceae bacterium]
MSDGGSPRARLGQRAEEAVVRYLENAGCSILDRNVKLGRLEIDIVARRAEVILVVEVRTRGAGAWTTGLGSMSMAKRERIRRAGQRLWRDRFKADPSVERMRFDAASVTFDGDRAHIDYVVAAF